MPNKLHEKWIAAKKSLEDEVAFFKKNGGLKVDPEEKALKTFTKGLGGMLEKVGQSHKAKNDKDVKKQAGEALKVAQKYKETVDGLRRGGISDARSQALKKAETNAKFVVDSLKDLQQNGAASRVAL
jgi:hypothetical protein